jgi:phosphoribosylaminoimidazole-succinocarboxamide synthase
MKLLALVCQAPAAFSFMNFSTSTMTAAALHTSQLHSLPLLARGKVRDNYAVGSDRILMVASDRISAFDVIMGEPIPGKGAC